MVATRRFNVVTYFKLKRCFDVAIEIFRLRHKNQLNTEKFYHDRKYRLQHEDTLKVEELCRDQNT